MRLIIWLFMLLPKLSLLRDQGIGECDIRGEKVKCHNDCCCKYSMFLQCWYFQECILRTTCLLVLLQLHLGVQTPLVGQMRGCLLTAMFYHMWKALKGRPSSCDFRQSWVPLGNSSHQCGKKMAFSCLYCYPIHHLSHSHWFAPSLVHTNHITMLAFMTGCFPT